MADLIASGGAPFARVMTERGGDLALPPIDLGLGPEAADDQAAVDAAHDRVRDTMQAALDDLVKEGGFGPAARFGNA